MANPTTGQVTVSASATPLTSLTFTAETLVIRSHPSNSAVVYFGPSGVTTSTGYPLSAGEEFTFSPTIGSLESPRPTDVYVIGTSGTIAWAATPK